MAVSVVMPKLGMTMSEGTVARWLRDDGAQVTRDEAIAEVMSKKISYEVKAPADGVLRQVARLDDTVLVGQPIAYITAPGEAIPERAAPSAAPAAEAPAPVQAAAPPTNGSAGGGAAERPLLATPMAKRLAREHGLDLRTIVGSGPGGRIQERDVLARIEQPAPAPAAPIAPAPAAGAGPAGRSIPFVGMRQAIAERLTDSLRQMAQVTLVTEVDVTALVELVEQLRQRAAVTVTAVIVKATAAALRQHPLLNATLVGNEIRLLPDVNVAVAVALESGLITPVLRQADRRGLLELDRELKRLGAAARAGELTVDEVTGGTFTITNLGMYGIDAFTPVINPPEVGILGIGRIVERPAIYRGEIARRSLMTLSLTFDHRLVDGAPAAAFLKTVAGLLEQPALALAGETLTAADGSDQA